MNIISNVFDFEDNLDFAKVFELSTKNVKGFKESKEEKDKLLLCMNLLYY